MISIPVSFLVSVVFLALAVSMAVRPMLPTLPRALFAATFLVLALETSLVGIRYVLATQAFLPIQRTLPVWSAPLLFLSFAALTASAGKVVRWIAVNAGAALAVSLAMLLPVRSVGYVDLLIEATVAVYLFLLLRLWRRGPDAFGAAPTHLGPLLHRVLAGAIGILFAVLVLDTLIAVFLSFRKEEAAAFTISAASLAFVAGAVALAILGFRSAAPGQSRQRTTEEEDDWRRIAGAARRLLLDKELFRDTDLTLTRLARRTGVSDRDLSRAINQVEGVNVSQFVNAIRLQEAASLLTRTSESVSTIQEKAGFLTRSNFYREFQKQFGVAPAQYRKQAHSSGKTLSK
ncbi:helix-turn-helix transcriptional regulator [Roseibium aggregatum]|uniref:Helix-turn-helix transcriptional regulator n=1 Tax=Roseibium aggregatum TaxID=187304 RepID=A0A939J165_9HYPH|nr:AraC family transcriptional regulator [Roseibium aggregatum]MBN9670018.1 helix-turn-helix transcriptional regulator [Roseibium aggregatum]